MAGSAPWDNVLLPRPPYSYSPPQVDFSPLGGLVGDYVAGRAAKQKLDVQDAFKSFLPASLEQSSDPYEAMAAKLFRLGAIGEGTELLKLGGSVGGSRDYNRALSGDTGSAAPRPSAPSAPSARSSGLEPSTAEPGAPGEAAADTLRSAATEAAGGKDVSGLIKTLGDRLGLDPDQPITADVAGRIRQAVAAMSTRGAAPTVQQSNDEAFRGPMAPKVVQTVPIAGGASASPPGAPGAVPEGGSASVPGTVPPGQESFDALIPPAWPRRGLEGAVSYRNRLQEILARPNLFPQVQKGMEDQVKAINEAIAKNAEEPPDVKASRAAGFGGNPLTYSLAKAQGEEQAKKDVDHYNNLRNSIDAAANSATRIEHYTQLARGILKDPNAYFGSGEGLNLAFKKIKNTLDPSNTESLAQEAFRKVTASSVLAQTEALKDAFADLGPGGGRLFQTQIELMEKAAGNPDNSANALRLLTEVADRGAKFSKEVARMAHSYRNGHLDNGFMQKLDDYVATHPMFSPAEMNDLRLIAPPEAPALNSVADAKAFEQRAGVRPGDPIKLPSGKIVPAP